MITITEIERKFKSLLSVIFSANGMNEPRWRAIAYRQAAKDLSDLSLMLEDTAKEFDKEVDKNG